MDTQSLKFYYETRMVVRMIAVCLLLNFFVVTMAEIHEVANADVRKFLETYDRSEPPSEGPTLVRVGIYANDFRIYEQQSVFEMVMYMRLAWRDERLEKLFTAEEKQDLKYKILEVPSHKYFWKPDVFFRNQRASDKRGTATDEALLRVNSTGDVWYVTSQISTFNCPGLPRQYYDDIPHLTCSVMIESFSHTMDTLELDWLSSPIEVDPGVMLLDFELSDVSLYNCSQNYTAGTFPCLELKFHIDRDPVNDHVGKTLYASSFMLVVAAWGGFWLDGLCSMTARLGLGLGTSAVIVLELGGAANWYEEWDLMGNKTQFWLAFCGFLSTLTVLELVVAHVVLGKLLTKLKGVKSGGQNQEDEKSERPLGRIIDVVFGLIIYPLIFIVFILVFFIKHFNKI